MATGLDKKNAKIRVASLQTVMGKECLSIFKSLDMSDKDRADPTLCIQALEDYFMPKRNEMYKRYVFYACDQGPNENVDTWVTRLRQLIKSCNFHAEERHNLLRDRIVLGTSDKSARLRMLCEKDLPLNMAIDMLRASEVTQSQISVIGKSGADEQVQFAKNIVRKNNPVVKYVNFVQKRMCGERNIVRHMVKRVRSVDRRITHVIVLCVKNREIS